MLLFSVNFFIWKVHLFPHKKMLFVLTCSLLLVFKNKYLKLFLVLIFYIRNIDGHNSHNNSSVVYKGVQRLKHLKTVENCRQRSHKCQLKNKKGKSSIFLSCEHIICGRGTKEEEFFKRSFLSNRAVLVGNLLASVPLSI